MKPISELNHYEVLEVQPDAPGDEIERAWRLARSTYDAASLAVYSIYGDDETREIRERIDQAWQVLSDPESRTAYDAELPAEEGVRELPLEISLAFDDPEGPVAVSAPVPLPTPEFETLEDDANAPFDGPRLRRSRLHRGLEIEHIAKETKINPTYLRFIEEERFDDLPAPVYVRGFVSAYARCVGLDADETADSYMKRFQASRVEEPPSNRRVR